MLEYPENLNIKMSRDYITRTARNATNMPLRQFTRQRGRKSQGERVQIIWQGENCRIRDGEKAAELKAMKAADEIQEIAGKIPFVRRNCHIRCADSGSRAAGVDAKAFIVKQI